MKTESEEIESEDEAFNAAWRHSPATGFWIFDLFCFVFIGLIYVICKRRRAKTESASEPKEEEN